MTESTPGILVRQNSAPLHKKRLNCEIIDKYEFSGVTRGTRLDSRGGAGESVITLLIKRENLSSSRWITSSKCLILIVASLL